MKVYLFSDIFVWRDDLLDKVSRDEVEGLLLDWLQGSSVLFSQRGVTLEERERERERRHETSVLFHNLSKLNYFTIHNVHVPTTPSSQG